MKSKTDWVGIQRATSDAAHRQEIAEANAKIKKYEEIIQSAFEQRDIALTLAKRPPTTHKISAKPPAGEESEATAFALAGDWHVEETITAASVNGLNEYSLEIADQRITSFFQSVLRLTEIERAGTRIPNLVLCLLGDMMTGYIHEELQESNGLSPTETVLWLRKRIVAGLRLLKDKGGFDKITVTANYGNHGRTTKKTRHATGAANSYEWMMYHTIKDEVPGVDWVIADGYFIFLEVYGRIFRIHHGDNLQYQGGIGGLTIPAEKAIASWNKSRSVYMDLFGHHHTAMQNPRWICNGAGIGYGPYSISIKAGFEDPSQTYFLLDSQRGRTGTWPIYL